MHMHFAINGKKLEARKPMCGYMADIDEICTDARLCTCPECLDWIRPLHDAEDDK
jgi:hypothetical protein